MPAQPSPILPPTTSEFQGFTSFVFCLPWKYFRTQYLKIQIFLTTQWRNLTRTAHYDTWVVVSWIRIESFPRTSVSSRIDMASVSKKLYRMQNLRKCLLPIRSVHYWVWLEIVGWTGCLERACLGCSCALKKLGAVTLFAVFFLQFCSNEK